MGEVYRVEDLKLGETVALKFLPESVERNARRLELLLSEAKLARQVSHPNVCRVHDVGEAEGHHFISMEYVEGEDLALLLRRIGRLPKAKAIELGLELCLGLDAVHRRQILHHDLKPANVMIDSAGRVRLTDFGLAGFAGAVARGGTAAYMAPELHVQGRSSIQSDLYALGLVLYEMFTGQRASQASRKPIRPPSSLVDGLHPAVEMVILDCLRRNPVERPASAREVAGVLSNLAHYTAEITGETAARIVVVRTLLLCELIGGTRLAEDLGDIAAADLLQRHDRFTRGLIGVHGGREIDRADGFLFLFERPLEAVLYALDYHRELRKLAEGQGFEIKARVGVHLAEVVLREHSPEDVKQGARPLEVEGLAKPMAARLMSLASGGQTLLTRSAFDVARSAAVGIVDAENLRWLSHGAYHFEGLSEPIEVCEVGREHLAPFAPPADSDKVKQAIRQLTVTGWRPAPGLAIPHRSHWRIEKRLGEGGFGEVWLAVHRKTGERRVFKFCFDAVRLRGLRREITLFRLLKEELGERDDITRILDWNFEEAPYFVESEYTAHGSLPDWLEEQGGAAQVPPEARLQIVAQVAVALAAAHSVGVLHKDVKPSNVLITEGVDGTVKAQLADFGVGLVIEQERLVAAGITADGLTERTSVNPASSFIGTRLYFAPELMEGKAVTLQADIYALGVMLFQLIVGDFTRALATGWERDVDDVLLVEDISYFVDGSPDLRPASALEVAARLHNLEKRRVQREETVAAREARKKARRRRRLYAAIAGVTLVLIGFGFGAATTTLWQQAEKRSEQAEKRSEQAEAVVEFFQRFLVASDPDSGRGEVTARELLDQARARLESDPPGEPDVEAMLRGTLGHLYRNLGFYNEGMELLEGAARMRREQYPAGHPDLVIDLNDLAGTYYYLGRWSEAESRYRESLEMRRRLGERPTAIARGLNNLAAAVMQQGRYDEAAELYGEALAIREGLADADLDLASTLYSLGTLHFEQGELDRAEPLLRRALDLRLRHLGERHTRVATLLNTLGRLCLAAGKFHEAEALQRRALGIRREIRGEDNYLTAVVSKDLAEVLLRRGQAAAAGELLAASLENLRGSPAPAWAVAEAESVYGAYLATVGHYEEAEPLLVSGFEAVRDGKGDRSIRTHQARQRLVALYEAWDRPERAAAYASH